MTSPAGSGARGRRQSSIDGTARLIDLSHVIEEGMTTFKGLPGPHLCDYWTREASAAHYDDGSSFQIGRIDMVANTGTYVDSPFHRYADGDDLVRAAARIARRPRRDRDPQAVRRRPRHRRRRLRRASTSRGKAVLVHTGWDRHWRTDAYFDDHPFLTAAAADWLVDARRRLRRHRQPQYRRHPHPRAARSTRMLLGAGIPIGEHLTNLGALSRPRLPLLRRPAQGQGHGHLPGPRLRAADG